MPQKGDGRGISATTESASGPWQRTTGEPDAKGANELHAPHVETTGFQPDDGIDEAVRVFIEDDLAMQKTLAG